MLFLVCKSLNRRRGTLRGRRGASHRGCGGGSPHLYSNTHSKRRNAEIFSSSSHLNFGE